MESLAAGHNLDDPKTKSEIAAQVLPLIADVPNLVERDAYRQRLARMLKVDERALSRRFSTHSAARGARISPAQTTAATPAAAEAVTESLGRRMEGHCLRLLMRQPENLYSLDRALQAAGLSRFSPQDFESADYQLLARFVLEALEQDQLEPQTHLKQHVPEALSELQRELLAPMTQGEPNNTARLDDLLRTLMNLRLLRVNEGIRQMRFMQEDLQQQGEVTLMPYQELLPQYIQARTPARISLVQTIPV